MYNSAKFLNAMSYYFLSFCSGILWHSGKFVFIQEIMHVFNVLVVFQSPFSVMLFSLFCFFAVLLTTFFSGQLRL
jgi:hypothetical protein